MAVINNRSELIFLYDVKDNNPNGDPLNENKPRIDEETGFNYVTDVRFKRTIRDYIALTHNQVAPNKIFLLAERKEDGTLKSMGELEGVYKSIKDLVKDSLDIRLFGGTIAVKKDKTKKAESEEASEEGSNAITGPVQFRLGRSMHKVLAKEQQITRTIPNDPGKNQGTFGYDQFLYYSLIKFYGVINENAAKTTNLTEEDVQKLIKAMWHGTKELNTRTKIGHTPRLLIKVDYKPGFFIGDLDSKVKLLADIPDEQIRTPDDYKIDLSVLNTILTQYKEQIVNIWIAVHPDIQIHNPLTVEGKTITKLEDQPWFKVI